MSSWALIGLGLLNGMSAPHKASRLFRITKDDGFAPDYWDIPKVQQIVRQDFHLFSHGNLA